MVAVHDAGQIRTVAQLAREIWTEHYVPIVGQAQIDYMLDKFQSASAITAQLADGYEYFLAIDDGQPVGYLAIVPDCHSSRMQLSKVYVRKHERGRGYGSRMLQFVEQQCVERQIRTLWLTVNKHNADSIACYLQLGFKNTGSVVQDIGGGFVMDDYCMGKTLPIM